jgi:hypothetical protein
MAGSTAGPRSDGVVQLATVVLAHCLEELVFQGVVVEVVNCITEEVGWDEAAMACRNRHIRKVR